MTYHIDLSPPDTLETLPRFSLYTTEKPDLEFAYSDQDLKKHLASHFAYLQEQEFKVGEIVYWDGGKRRHNIEEVLPDREQIILHDVIGPLPFSVISHYPPGQTVPSSAISYVREVKIPKPKAIMKKIFKTKAREGIDEWKQFNKDKFEWQPSPEPEKPKLRGKFSKLTETYSRDYDNYKSAHTEWAKDIKSGTVQATIKLNI